MATAVATIMVRRTKLLLLCAPFLFLYRNDDLWHSLSALNLRIASRGASQAIPCLEYYATCSKYLEMKHIVTSIFH